MRADRFDLPLRIVVQHPFPGLALFLQKGATGRGELVSPTASSPDEVAFDLEITVSGTLADGRPRFLGPHVQGPPAGRFTYICVCQTAGEAWNGRIKVPLGQLGWPLIEGLPAGSRIEGRITGRRKDKPALATVPILAPGWAYSLR